MCGFSPPKNATYLQAREIADRFNIPCGWEINLNLSHSEALDDLEVNRLEQPAAKKPTSPTGPPPPKRRLD